MKMKKRILSALLAVLMLATSIALVAPVSAVEIGTGEGYSVDPSSIDIFETRAYYLKEDKLADMGAPVKVSGNIAIYVQRQTGEMAFQNLTTGQVLFSNPYDLNSPFNQLKGKTLTSTVKRQLLSQIILKFTDNGTDNTMYSFADAALNNQIAVKATKNGVRVEYALGEPNTTYLVPRLIERDRFEMLIMSLLQSKLDDFSFQKFMAYYELKNPNDPANTPTMLASMNASFPCTAKEYTSTTYEGYMAVYTITDPAARELRMMEDWIVTYCPRYTQEEMEYDHELTGYEGNDEAPPLFRLALEYTIENDGVSVRLPANSIRYDESRFQIKDITILPYMGAGICGVVSDGDGSGVYSEGEYEVTNLEGYTFVPDGSGAILRYQDLVGGSLYTLSGDVYGADFAYHKISQQHAETMRLPVFGVVTDYDTTVYWEETTEDNGKYYVTKKYQDVDEERGYFAVITEGESMARITSEHGGTQHSYNSVYATFSPLPTDSYEVEDSVSVSGGSSTWTVTSDRKYTGSYTIRYIMLEGDRAAKTFGLKDWYSCSYVGMADAYRTYLYDTGALTRIENAETDIPLYIETFGSILTTERVLSIPVEVDTPLTTFEDVQTMYMQLKNAKRCDTCGDYVYDEADEAKHAEDCDGTLSPVGINNTNFRLTGFANGGMKSTYPAKLKWVSVLGGDDGYENLVKFAAENGIEIYPDFDFVYINETEVFDGISNRSDAVKTIDNRYSTKRFYDAATQSFQKTLSVLVSASRFGKFYDKLSDKLLDFYKDGDIKAISLSTLGTDLNSDFDDDDPYNRSDSQTFSERLLAAAKEDFGNVMVDAGNAYTLPYASVILNVATDSSRYIRASQSVPFVGMVLHGSKQYAGAPINMEGDVSEALLKAIENGADPYFILSYQNITLLKNDKDLSEYYSVSYEIWRDQLIEVYHKLNDALASLQSSWIVGHSFLDGKRVPTATELETLSPDDSRFDVALGSIVSVTYEDGTTFILNYNSFEVTTEYGGKTYTVGAFDFATAR